MVDGLQVPRSWSAAVVTEQAQLEGLRDEWDELWAATPGAGPFQRHGWVTNWARHYVGPGRLRVVTVRHDGSLVAAAPLFLERRGPWPVLTTLGGAVSDVSDVLATDGFTGWDTMSRALTDRRDWCVVDLPEVSGTAVARGWAEAWRGRVSRLDASVSLELPVALPDPMGHVLSRLPGRTANTLRRKLRKADAAGISAAEVGAGDVPRFVDTFLDLHAEQWAGRGVVAEHLTARFRSFLLDALAALVEDGSAVLTEFRHGDEVLLSQVDLFGHDVLAYYLAGISPRLRPMVDTAALIVSHDLELAARRGLTRYSMLRGTEDYKQRWRPLASRSDRLLLYRPGLPGRRGHLTALRGRRKIAPTYRAVRGVAGRLAQQVRPPAAEGTEPRTGWTA